MACLVIPGGGFVCGRPRPGPCSVPGCGRMHGILCDFPVERKGAKGTCDAKLCRRCAKELGPEIHVCPAHAKVPFPGAVQLELGAKP